MKGASVKSSVIKESLFLRTERNLLAAGMEKGNKPVLNLLLAGILAGLYIGFGGQFFLAALAAGMSKVAGGLVFSLGLVLVAIAGAELFTGNMILIIPVLDKKLPAGKMIKNWLIVYAGNFIGSILLVLLVWSTGLLKDAVGLNTLGRITAAAAQAKMNLSFTEALFRGILCNILVVLAVILSASTEKITAKILCIIFPITCFVACGFEHSIANMYLIPLGLIHNGDGIFCVFASFKNILPVTLGNIIGGLFILVIHPVRLKKLFSAKKG